MVLSMEEFPCHESPTICFFNTTVAVYLPLCSPVGIIIVP